MVLHTSLSSTEYTQMFGLIKEDYFKQLTKIIPILYLRNKNFLWKKIIKK